MALGWSGQTIGKPVTIRLLKNAAFVVVLSVVWIGQLSDAVAQNFSFSRIQIEGNTRIGDSAILSQAGITQGQTLSAGQVNDALQKLQNSGLFESVEVIPQGSTLRIVVVELPTVNRISFEGNRRIDDEALGAVIQTRERRVFNPSQAERDASAIAEAYSTEGRIAARVSPRIIRRTDNRVDVVFEVFEGDVIEIERISFVGNRAYSDRRLRGALQTTQANFLRAFIRTDTFIGDRLQFDRQALQDFYADRGYVDFRILSVNSELTEERDGYFVTFNLQEGQQFRFGNVTVVSEYPAADEVLYQSLIKTKPGTIYSPRLVENEIARMERKAIKDGTDFLRVEPRVSRNDRDLTLDVEFVLTRGPRIFVERIDIEGNTTTLDRVVRRQFDIAEGDPFNPRAIRQSAERIRALNYFENTDVNAREGSTPDQVVIDVDVEEKPTGSLGFGASYSVNDGAGVSVRFSERNFLGRGQTLSFEFSTASEREAYNLNFVEPSFLGRDVAFGLRLGLSQSNSRFLTYENETIIFEPSLTFPISENGRLQVRYTARRDEMSSLDVFDAMGTLTDDNTGDIIGAEITGDNRTTSSLGYTYSYDTRRTGLDPTAGILFQFSQDFAGLGGDTDYVKTTARLTGQRMAFGEEVTLRATVEGGYLSFSGNSLAIDRFLLNPNIIRGFEPGGIGPRDAGATDDALGGNLYVAARFEAEFPIGLPDQLGITGAVFYDIGNLWDLDNANPGNLATVGEGGSFRHVIGFSIIWESIFGPLRFNFSDAIRKEDFDREQTFDLTVQTTF